MSNFPGPPTHSSNCATRISLLIVREATAISDSAPLGHGLRLRLRAVAAGLLCCASLTSSSAASSVGIAIFGGNINEIELEPDGEVLDWREATTLDSALRIQGLALTQAEQLFAITYTSFPAPVHSLVSVDLNSGAATALAELDSAVRVNGLALDGLEQLWTTVNGQLALLDRDGTVTRVPVATDSLMAISGFEGGLFGITRASQDEYWLLEIDAAAGTATPLARLDFHHDDPEPHSDAPTSMAFDANGGLWVIARHLFDFGGVPFFTSEWLYFPDPLSGLPAPRPQLAHPGAIVFHFAVTNRTTAIEVPALRPVGVAAMAFLLALGGWSYLRP